MPENTAAKSMMRIPLLVAAAVVIIRIITEQMGAPEAVNAIFGVAWLYFLVPIYFAMQITARGEASPYKSLLKNTVLYALYTRLMVFPTYMLAYHFGWSAPRFKLSNGGVVGDNVSAIMGYLVIPVRNLAIWVVLATIVGMALGSIVVAIRRKSPATKTA